MNVDADGPPHGGTVQFKNWTYPGYALRSLQASNLASMLRFAAMIFDGKSNLTPEKLAKLAHAYRRKADALDKGTDL